MLFDNNSEQQNDNINNNSVIADPEFLIAALGVADQLNPKLLDLCDNTQY